MQIKSKLFNQITFRIIATLLILPPYMIRAVEGDGSVEEAMPLITQFPTELFYKVFSHIPSLQDRSNVSQSCKLFHSIACSDLVLKSVPVPCIRVTPSQLENIREGGEAVKHLELTISMLDPFTMETANRLKRYKHLKSLRLRRDLRGAASISNLNFLSDLPELQALKINDIDVEEFSPDNVVSSLNSLQIHHAYFPNSKLQNMVKMFPALQKLRLSFSNITDKEAEIIANAYPNLKNLNLDSNNMLTDEGVGFIASKCSGLSHLNLNGVRLSGQALIKIAEGCRNLVYFANVIPESYDYETESLKSLFCKYDALTHLEVGWGGIGKYFLESSDPCCQVTCLSIGHFSGITDELLERMLKKLPNLTHLEIGQYNNITGASFKIIAKCCPNLVFVKIDMPNSAVDASEGYRAIAENCKQITHFEAPGCRCKTGNFEVLSEFGHCFVYLNLSNAAVTDIGVESIIKSCPNLAHLNLSSNFITYIGLENIVKNYPNIVYLDICCATIKDYSCLYELKDLESIGNRPGDRVFVSILKGLRRLNLSSFSVGRYKELLDIYAAKAYSISEVGPIGLYQQKLINSLLKIIEMKREELKGSPNENETDMGIS